MMIHGHQNVLLITNQLCATHLLLTDQLDLNNSSRPWKGLPRFSSCTRRRWSRTSLTYSGCAIMRSDSMHVTRFRTFPDMWVSANYGSGRVYMQKNTISIECLRLQLRRSSNRLLSTAVKQKSFFVELKRKFVSQRLSASRFQRGEHNYQMEVWRANVIRNDEIWYVTLT